MAKGMSRLDRLKAAAKAKAEEQRAELERKAAAGDTRAVRALELLGAREQTILERIERAHARQHEKQRLIQLRIERATSQRGQDGRTRRGRVQPADVVAAALDLLDENGVYGVTLRDVAARLNVQAPALYWHFAGKSDIV